METPINTLILTERTPPHLLLSYLQAIMSANCVPKDVHVTPDDLAESKHVVVRVNHYADESLSLVSSPACRECGS